MGAFLAEGVPPDQPSLRTETLTGKSVALNSSSFRDPDLDDTHEASQWQIAVVTDGAP